MEWVYEKNKIKAVDETGKLMSEADFMEMSNGEIVIEHVFVEDAFRGQGLAGETMKVMAEYLREHHKKTTATCSYANAWLHKNQMDYCDIISSDMTDIQACKTDQKH